MKLECYTSPFEKQLNKNSVSLGEKEMGERMRRTVLLLAVRELGCLNSLFAVVVTSLAFSLRFPGFNVHGGTFCFKLFLSH